MTFAKEAWPFVLPFPLIAGVLVMLGHQRTALGFLIAGLLILLFFRDPARRFDGPADVVLAPADGKVISVEEMADPEIGPGQYWRIATFLSVFDVHVQKVPAAGEVLASTYTEGKKMAAFRSGIDRVNQRHLAVLKRPNGDLIGVRQIAGLFARRVVCYLEKGQRVHRGQALGVIKFGSRVDLFVPVRYTVRVKAGDRLKNGETPVAEPIPTGNGGSP